MVKQPPAFHRLQKVSCWEPITDDLHRAYRCGSSKDKEKEEVEETPCLKIFDPADDVALAREVADKLEHISAGLLAFATFACCCSGYGVYKIRRILVKWRRARRESESGASLEDMQTALKIGRTSTSTREDVDVIRPALAPSIEEHGDLEGIPEG